MSINLSPSAWEYLAKLAVLHNDTPQAVIEEGIRLVFERLPEPLRNAIEYSIPANCSIDYLETVELTHLAEISKVLRPLLDAVGSMDLIEFLRSDQSSLALAPAKAG